MYCSKCGKQIEEDSKFCPFCGVSQERNATSGGELIKQGAEEAFKDVKSQIGMATLFLTKIIRCCECCGVMAPIALDNEHPRI